MKEIPLNHGLVATISDEDYEYISQWKWYAKKDGNTWYAVRSQNIGRVEGKQKTKMTMMHRVVLSRKLGHEDFELVDHIDRDGLSNCRDNLRPVTRKQNGENRRSANKNNKSSGIRGVCFRKKENKWQSSICHNGKMKHLGYFDNAHDAEQAVIAAQDELFTHTNLKGG